MQAVETMKQSASWWWLGEPGHGTRIGHFIDDIECDDMGVEKEEFGFLIENEDRDSYYGMDSICLS